MNKTTFRSQYSGLNFGKNQKATGPFYSWKDENNKKKIVNLRGKMDRVDLAKVDDRVLGEVIDYKSSAKKFDLGLSANGISMQMISYLEVLKKNNKFPAQDKDLGVLGAFYRNITSSLECLSSDKMILSNYQIKDLLKESTKRLMYSGILIADKEILDLIEPGMEKDRANLEIYSSIRRKINGDINWPRNQSFTPDQLELLLAYNSCLIKNAGSEILPGKIKLDPHTYGQQNSLTYSDFKDIFFFDTMLKEDNYHKIKAIDKKTLLNLIREKLDLDGDEWMTKSTKEQDQAVNDSGEDILVFASTGSDKTTVLVERVLKKILSDTPVSSLLIITFTKAAACEMKERIKQKISD